MNRKILVGLAVAAALYLVITSSASYYIDYAWYGIHGGTGIFWTLFMTKFNVQMLFMAAFVVLFFLNFLLMRVLGGKGRIFTSNIMNRLQIPVLGTPRRALFLVIAAGVVVTGFFMGGAAASFWKEWLMFTNAVPFTGFPTDPIFNHDIGFYVFSLPFYRFLYGWLMAALVITTAFSLLFHLVNGGIIVQNNRIEFSLFARAHLSTLLAVIVLLFGVGYELSAYNLLFSKIGKIYGAGYTAVHTNLVAYRVAMVISFIAVGLFLFNIFKRSFTLPILVLASIIPIFFVLGTVAPAIWQRLVVEPNELDKEKPFIEHNIRFTRLAYDIDRVKTASFANRPGLTQQDILKNRDTIENIRLWDWRPLKQTYRQLQELKPYYFFNDVDVDRYVIDGKTMAVNLSARELSIDRLGKAAQTWQNRHLIFTHGYGVVMSRVDRVTPEGMPDLILRDIPTRAAVNLKLDQPQIYFGEHHNDYVVTNTEIKDGEFDYPSGDKNKYTIYQGKGGAKLDSFLKRLLFAAAYRDINILISGSITNNSRILFKRNIAEMVSEFTPFLDFDDDPYVVIADGKIYWIIDGYTTTDQFPYSTPMQIGQRKINYIRNAVKVVIDAYDGTMTYYRADERDPIIGVYARMFPGVFKKLDEMPAAIRAHVRYPEDFFNVQSRALLTYHVTTPNVFYNNEDAWAIPNQIYESSEVPVHSYYYITRLPEEKKSGFVLILPFTPYGRDNMIAFLAAKCDGPDYGELRLYLLPKERNTYGPKQIESRIDQDPEISKQLTLWNQKGSGVIRGNMMAIPIEESILYVEPLYLKAETSEMPELKRVIVVFGDRVVMEQDLGAALQRLFAGVTFTDDRTGVSGDTHMRDLARQATYHYQQAEASQREGNWAAYGENMQRLKEVLQRMNAAR